MQKIFDSKQKISDLSEDSLRKQKKTVKWGAGMPQSHRYRDGVSKDRGFVGIWIHVTPKPG